MADKTIRNRINGLLESWVDLGSNVFARKVVAELTVTPTISDVKILNGAGGDKAVVDPANTARSATSKVLSVQVIDAAGNVLATAALSTAAKQDTLAGLVATATNQNSMLDYLNSMTDGQSVGFVQTIERLQMNIDTLNAILVELQTLNAYFVSVKNGGSSQIRTNVIP